MPRALPVGICISQPMNSVDITTQLGRPMNNTTFKLSLLACAVALAGCDSSSSGSSEQTPEERALDSLTGTDVSAMTISAQGGSSTLGYGAEGGYISIEKSNSVAPLNLLKVGKVDVSYTLPAQKTDLGSNPLVVDSIVTVVRLTDTTLPSVDTLYMTNNSNYLFQSDGLGIVGAEEQRITGIQINTGAHLTLPKHPNYSYVSLLLINDIQNDGVLAVENALNDYEREDLSIYAAAYYGSGNIDMSGDGDRTNGQNGGNIHIEAHTIQNSGSLTTSGAIYGGEGSGGQSGSIGLYASVFVENTGSLTTTGGSSNGNGADAGDVEVYGASIYNTGDITANHGPGYGSYSSNDADVSFNAAKELINTGNITVDGVESDSTASRGGDIYLGLDSSNTPIQIAQSRFANLGNLSVQGGNLTGDNANRAGYGGGIEIEIDGYDSESSVSSKMDVKIAGNINANGGDDSVDSNELFDGDAGRAGYINIEIDQNPTALEPVFIMGYDTINLSGGAGVYGAEGGGIEISSNTSGPDQDENAGPIFNQIDIIANGASSLAANTVDPSDPSDEVNGTGGSGGYVYIGSRGDDAYMQSETSLIANTGDISAMGGDSHTSSSSSNAYNRGGYVNAYALSSLTMDQTINVNGGSNTHASTSSENFGHVGADAGFIGLQSLASAVTATGSYSANGGQADRIGGDAGSFMSIAQTALNIEGTIELNGGNAIADAVDIRDTQGGDAGSLLVVSAALNSQVTESITATAGTGDIAGENSNMFIDADCRSEVCNLEDLMDEVD
jgi:hypothetical protein